MFGTIYLYQNLTDCVFRSFLVWNFVSLSTDSMYYYQLTVFILNNWQYMYLYQLTRPVSQKKLGKGEPKDFFSVHQLDPALILTSFWSFYTFENLFFPKERTFWGNPGIEIQILLTKTPFIHSMLSIEFLIFVQKKRISFSLVHF